MYADSINVSSTAGSSSSLAYLKNQLQSNVSRENYEWNELMQQQSEENSNIGGKQNECRNIESVTLNSVNEKNQEKCGEEQCYGIETLMNETEEGTRSNHLRNEMKSQPSTILSEVAKELVLHQCSNKAQNELENRLWEGVNPYVYNEFYDTPEKILNGIMSDLKKTEDWRKQIKSLETLRSICLSHPHLLLSADLRDLIRQVVDCSLSLRSGVSRIGLKTIACILHVLADNSQGASAIDTVIPLILPKSICEKRFVATTASDCLSLICQLNRPSIQARALSCLSRFVISRNASIASKASELVSNVVTTMLFISTILPLVGHMVVERQPLAKKSARLILSLSKNYFSSSTNNRFIHQHEYHSSTHSLNRHQGFNGIQSPSTTAISEPGYIDSKYFQSLVRRYLDEECSLSQVERLALQKAIQSIKDDDVPSSSMLSPVTYRTDATTAAASPRYLLSSLQFSTQSSKTAVDASEQHPTRPRLKIIPHGLPCTPKSVSVRSNSPLQSTYLPFRRHPSPCSAPSRTQNRRPDLSRCQTAIDHSTQCSVKLEGERQSTFDVSSSSHTIPILRCLSSDNTVARHQTHQFITATTSTISETQHPSICESDLLEFNREQQQCKSRSVLRTQSGPVRPLLALNVSDDEGKTAQIKPMHKGDLKQINQKRNQEHNQCLRRAPISSVIYGNKAKHLNYTELNYLKSPSTFPNRTDQHRLASTSSITASLSSLPSSTSTTLKRPPINRSENQRPIASIKRSLQNTATLPSGLSSSSTDSSIQKSASFNSLSKTTRNMSGHTPGGISSSSSHLMKSPTSARPLRCPSQRNTPNTSRREPLSKPPKSTIRNTSCSPARTPSSLPQRPSNNRFTDIHAKVDSGLRGIEQRSVQAKKQLLSNDHQYITPSSHSRMETLGTRANQDGFRNAQMDLKHSLPSSKTDSGNAVNSTAQSKIQLITGSRSNSDSSNIVEPRQVSSEPSKCYASKSPPSCPTTLSHKGNITNDLYVIQPFPCIPSAVVPQHSTDPSTKRGTDPPVTHKPNQWTASPVMRYHQGGFKQQNGLRSFNHWYK